MTAQPGPANSARKTGPQKIERTITPLYAGVMVRFLNIYFPVNFALVAGLGIYSLTQEIPNRHIIPFVIAFSSLMLIPGLLFREIVAYATLVGFPFVMIVNGYEYSIALSCWYPVLINAFLISLLRKNAGLFACLCVYHLAGLAAITLKLVDPHARFWYMGLITNLMACGVLGLTYFLFIKNEQLNGNLQKLIKIVRHDIGNWINLLTLGISLSKKNNEPVHKLVEEGTKNLNDWIHRLKSKMPFDTFAYLEIVPLQSFVQSLEKCLGGMVLLNVSTDGSLKGKNVLTDQGILLNCFMNLVRNAAQAGAREVRISFNQGPGRSCTVVVEDNGKGIPAHIADALFSVQVASEKPEGSGFGLLGVRYNLEFMGCSIEIVNANSDGKGTTVFKILGLKIS